MDPLSLSAELRYLAFSAALGLVGILLAAYATAVGRQDGLRWAAGPRDTPQPPPSGIAGRLTRARDNFGETFPLFAAAVLITHVTGNEGAPSGWGAALYFWARAAFLPIYAFGVPYVRSLVWGVAMAGMLLVLVAPLLN